MVRIILVWCKALSTNFYRTIGPTQQMLLALDLSGNILGINFLHIVCIHDNHNDFARVCKDTAAAKLGMKCTIMQVIRHGAKHH